MPTASTPDWDAALARWAAGESGRVIAAELGLSYFALQHRAAKAGLRRPKGRPRITGAKEDQIERLYRDRISIRGIMATTGCAMDTVQRVIRERGLRRTPITPCRSRKGCPNKTWALPAQPLWTAERRRCDCGGLIIAGLEHEHRCTYTGGKAA